MSNVKMSKAAIDDDVRKLLTLGSDFERHLTNGEFDAAQADMDSRDVIVKNDRKAWDLARQKHAAMEAADAA